MSPMTVLRQSLSPLSDLKCSMELGGEDTTQAFSWTLAQIQLCARHILHTGEVGLRRGEHRSQSLPGSLPHWKKILMSTKHFLSARIGTAS